MRFSGFIWPPAYKFHKEILEQIDAIQYFTYSFEHDAFKNFVTEMYKTDDVRPETVQNVKLPKLLEYPSKFVYFVMEIDNPNYRLKANGNQISETVSSIKMSIREKYRDKIPGYISDIIIHTSDNTSQAEQIAKLMSFQHEMEFTNTKFLHSKQTRNGINHRCDIKVRLDAANTGDFGNYLKMQNLRGGRGNCGYDTVGQFKALIKSVKESGLTNESIVHYINDFVLADGAHRLSLAILYDIQYIRTEKSTTHIVTGYGNYDPSWFAKHKMTF